MAVSSVSATLIPSLSLSTSSSSSFKPKLSPFSLHFANSSAKLRTVKPSQSSTRVYAAPEVLEPPPETLDESGAETLEGKKVKVPIFLVPATQKVWMDLYSLLNFYQSVKDLKNHSKQLHQDQSIHG
ncbi:small ribosomal subunit protein uS10c-like isoform X1 [Cannabis sativa]|uniref:small ribosomal subunit protein uS10c-like isoform X1 n=1 Tax=Cannabis sativa TaxID=3483 RepID=UPI0029CA2566|nr:small ribosomal subunit protein uS10c-like isoform X1 [Cannabis sativa]